MKKAVFAQKFVFSSSSKRKQHNLLCSPFLLIQKSIIKSHFMAFLWILYLLKHFQINTILSKKIILSSFFKWSSDFRHRDLHLLSRMPLCYHTAALHNVSVCYCLYQRCGNCGEVLQVWNMHRANYMPLHSIQTITTVVQFWKVSQISGCQ